LNLCAATTTSSLTRIQICKANNDIGERKFAAEKYDGKRNLSKQAIESGSDHFQAMKYRQTS
jgi:hypothetical protein